MYGWGTYQIYDMFDDNFVLISDFLSKDCWEDFAERNSFFSFVLYEMSEMKFELRTPLG